MEKLLDDQYFMKNQDANTLQGLAVLYLMDKAGVTAAMNETDYDVRSNLGSLKNHLIEMAVFWKKVERGSQADEGYSFESFMQAKQYWTYTLENHIPISRYDGIVDETYLIGFNKIISNTQNPERSTYAKEGIRLLSIFPDSMAKHIEELKHYI